MEREGVPHPCGFSVRFLTLLFSCYVLRPPTPFSPSPQPFKPQFGGSSTGAWSTGQPRSRKDRKSTRLNSSHSQISYAVFCLKKKKNRKINTYTSSDHLNATTHHTLT